MGGADIGSAVCGAANHDWAVDETSTHVADLTRIVDDLIPCHIGEAPEHEFHHGADAQHGGADTHADEAGFANWSINHALVAEALPEAFGDFVGAVVLSHFFSDDDDIFVTDDFLGEGVIEGFAVGDQRHV